MTAVLKENKLWAFVSTTVAPPAADPIALDIHEVKEARTQRLLLDGVRDHLIPHLAEKQTAKGMWDTLKSLYENKNENRKMALKDKLHGTKMVRGENVASYLTRLRQIKDELSAVGEVIPDPELVRIALKGFTKEWDVFVKCVVGRENFPSWERLWDDFTQEEIREGKTEQVADEENVALSTKGRKKKGGSSSGAKDLSKVKCFACQSYGHYAGQCPNKKKNKKKEEPEKVSSTEVGDFAKEFEKEFSLVSILSDSSVAESLDTGAWYMDSGAARHMTGIRAVFRELTDHDRVILTEDGYAGTHAVEGVGKVIFQLESGGYLEVGDVLFVPELKRNLVSVSALEDDGYAVLHVSGHVYIYPVSGGLGAASLLGIRDGRMYRVLGHPVDGEPGERSDSVAAAVAVSMEDSSNSVRKQSWYDMVLQDEQESEENSQFRVVRRRPSAVVPVQRSDRHSDSEGASVIGGRDPGGADDSSTSLAKREC